MTLHFTQLCRISSLNRRNFSRLVREDAGAFPLLSQHCCLPIDIQPWPTFTRISISKGGLDGTPYPNLLHTGLVLGRTTEPIARTKCAVKCVETSHRPTIRAQFVEPHVTQAKQYVENNSLPCNKIWPLNHLDRKHCIPTIWGFPSRGEAKAYTTNKQLFYL